MRLGLNSLWGRFCYSLVDGNFVSNFHRIRNRQIIFLYRLLWVRNVADLSFSPNPAGDVQELKEKKVSLKCCFNLLAPSRHHPRPREKV